RQTGSHLPPALATLDVANGRPAAAISALNRGRSCPYGGTLVSDAPGCKKPRTAALLRSCPSPAAHQQTAAQRGKASAAAAPCAPATDGRILYTSRPISSSTTRFSHVQSGRRS